MISAGHIVPYHFNIAGIKCIILGALVVVILSFPARSRTMAEQLKTVTSEKQTCSICLQTIRKNSRWWHMTECPQPHFFHWDCWHDYRKDACAQGQGDRTRIKCPYAGILRFQKPISWRLCSAICGSRMQRLRPLSLPFCIARQKSVRAVKTTTGEESKQLARNRIKHGHWPKPSLTK